MLMSVDDALLGYGWDVSADIGDPTLDAGAAEPWTGAGLTTPTDNGIGLDRFNDLMRAGPLWQNFMARAGYGTPGNLATTIRLTDNQRRALQAELQAAGVMFDPGMEIDPAGNVNQDQSIFGNNKWVRFAIIGAAVAATVFGVPGLWGGFVGGGAGGAGATATVPMVGGGV